VGSGLSLAECVDPPNGQADDGCQDKPTGEGIDQVWDHQAEGQCQYRFTGCNRKSRSTDKGFQKSGKAVHKLCIDQS